MPRKPIIRSNEHYYHLVARSNNKEAFYLPMEVMWQLTNSRLRNLQEKFDLKIGAFVLMNNHFHLLLLTPNEDIDRIMYFFMKDVTKDIQRRTGRINKIFGGRYKGCLIENHYYLVNVYRYIYQNPLRAGIVNRIEDYPFSTFSDKNFRLEELFPEMNRGHELEWLNASTQDEETKSIKCALRKSVFSYMKQRNTGRSIVPKS